MAPIDNSEYIYDWNIAAALPIPPGTRVLLNDETLRDGLQNPSVYDPTIEEKIEILHLMESLGIESLNIGLPGAGPRAVEHTEALAREIATNRMKIRPHCAARTAETVRRVPPKPTSVLSLKFRSGSASPSKPPPFSAPARSGALSKTGLSITSNALPKKPSSSSSNTICRRCSSP